MGNEKNNYTSQETITAPKENPQRIQELERKLEQKNQEIQQIKKQSESNIKTDLTKGIIKQNKNEKGYNHIVAVVKIKLKGEEKQNNFIITAYQIFIYGGNPCVE